VSWDKKMRVLIRGLHPKFGVYKDMLDRDLNRIRRNSKREEKDAENKDEENEDEQYNDEIVEEYERALDELCQKEDEIRLNERWRHRVRPQLVSAYHTERPQGNRPEKKNPIRCYNCDGHWTHCETLPKLSR
jgi:hypothetical protein